MDNPHAKLIHTTREALVKDFDAVASCVAGGGVLVITSASGHMYRLSAVHPATPDPVPPEPVNAQTQTPGADAALAELPLAPVPKPAPTHRTHISDNQAVMMIDAYMSTMPAGTPRPAVHEMFPDRYEDEAELAEILASLPA